MIRHDWWAICDDCGAESPHYSHVLTQDAVQARIKKLGWRQIGRGFNLHRHRCPDCVYGAQVTLREHDDETMEVDE